MSSPTSTGPARSSERSTSSAGRHASPPEPIRSTRSLMPGLLRSPTSFTAKFTRSFSVPPSIHSWPVCQPSTVGGSKSCCPIRFAVPEYATMPGVGARYVPTSFITPVISSTGLFTFLKRAALKKSELNRALSMERMSPPDCRYAATSVFTASWSCGGTVFQDGTCGSSATKKLYMCRAIKRAVAGCSTMMSMMSSPLRLPDLPRNVLSPSSWSSPT